MSDTYPINSFEDTMSVSLKPDGYLSDGTPVYFKLARGSTKSSYQLELYAKMLGFGDA